MRVAFGGNFDSPIEEALTQGIEVLDSGCGMHALFHLLTMNLLLSSTITHSNNNYAIRSCYLDIGDVRTVSELELPRHRHFTQIP